MRPPRPCRLVESVLFEARIDVDPIRPAYDRPRRRSESARGATSASRWLGDEMLGFAGTPLRIEGAPYYSAARRPGIFAFVPGVPPNVPRAQGRSTKRAKSTCSYRHIVKNPERQKNRVPTGPRQTRTQSLPARPGCALPHGLACTPDEPETARSQTGCTHASRAHFGDVPPRHRSASATVKRGLHTTYARIGGRAYARTGNGLRSPQSRLRYHLRGHIGRGYHHDRGYD